MSKLEFEYFTCTGRNLFAPINDTAKELCRIQKRKNLTEEEVEFHHKSGHEVVLRVRPPKSETLKTLVVYECSTS